PSNIATYVVAQRAGVPIHKYLDAQTLEQVATAEQHLSAKEKPRSTGTATAERIGRTAPTITVKEAHLGRIKVPDRALSRSRLDEAEKMAGIYPLLYAFENS